MFPIENPVLRKPYIITPLFISILLLLSLCCFSQTICSDTIIRNRFYLNSDTSITGYKDFLQPSGSSYFVGKAWKSNSTIFNAVLSKKDRWGNQFWNRIITTTNGDSSFVIEQVLESPDQSVLVLGIVQSPASPFRESPTPVLLHLDNNGFVINSWRIDLNETSNINAFFRSFLCQVDPNSIALLVNYASEDFTSAFVVMKIDIANGTCLWTNKFYKNNFFYVNGMIAFNNELVIANNFSNGSSSQIKQGINFIKIDLPTGALLVSRSYENIFSTSLPTADHFGTLRRLSNNNLKLVYSTSKDNEPNKIIDACFDNNFNIIRINATANIPDNYLVRNYSIDNSGTFAFGFFNALNLNDQGYIVVDSSGRLIQQRKLRPPANGNFTALFSNNALSVANDHKLTVFTAVNNNSKIEMETISTNVYNRDTGCIGFNFNEALVEDFSLQSSSWITEQATNTLPELISYAITNNNLFIQQQEVCLNVKTYTISLPDTVAKCNNDSIVLKSSSDFLKYNWQPNSYSIQINDSSLKVSPPFSTDYSVAAQTYWGCIVRDTTKIIANTSTPIHLPNDTSICDGANLTLDAGASFVKYLWNDGSSERYKKILSAGQYIVEATDSNNCISRDSFQLAHLYQRPYPNIHQKQVLCLEQNNILNPGTFASYLWQDGSTNQNYSVQNTGVYWVKVRNENNCENSDTVIVTSLVHAPVNFIKTDTSICSYESIVLKPFQSYTSYQWNDGSTLSYLEVHQPGNYSLMVTDNNGCVGQQAIIVTPKTCSNILIFPSAFTPNNDGLNDYFKPFVKSSFVQYNLSIYNRWGQKIFSTTDPTKGWNGSIDGKQPNGVFIWLCNYQFKGEKAKVQKGTFALIR